MKICIFITSINPGGAEKIMLQLAKFFIQKNHSVIFVSFENLLDNKNNLYDEISNLGIKNIFIKSPIYSKILSIFSHFLPIIGINNFRKILKSEKPDIILSNLNPTHNIATLSSIGLNIPVIKIIHSTETFKNKIFNTISSLLSTKTIVVSYFLKKNILNRYINPSKKIKLIYNGIENLDNLNTNYYKNTNINIVTSDHINSKTINIGILARYDIRKNHILLFKAIKSINKLNSKKIKLFCIGDGPEHKNLKLYIKENNLKKNIFLCGYKKDVTPWINSLDFFTLPSIDEGLGISLLEILSLGKPVIGSNIGGIPEILLGRKSSLIFLNNNLPDLISKINEMVENIKSFTIIANKEKNNILKNFSYNKMGNLYLNIIENIINE